MKIAFLSLYSGSVNRGVEAYVDEIAKRLAKKHKVTVYQEGKPKKDVSYQITQIKMDIDWKRKDMTGTFWRRIFLDYWSRQIGTMTLKALPKLCKERHDIVIPLNGGWQPKLIRLLTWFYAGKMVCSGQSGMGWDDRINLWCLPNAFVSISSKANKWAKRANPLIKCVYIPNGVDLKKFKPGDSKFSTSLKKPIVLTVGALTPQKRIDLVIRAVAKMKNASLLIVGDGLLKKELHLLANKLLKDRFEIVSVKHNEMPDIYRCTDIFTLSPYSSEAFGIVHVEAMATNLPVVALDDEQRREIVGKAGVFVKDPKNSKFYADALKKALNKNWANIPRHQAEKFSWDEIVKVYEKLFISLINK